LFEKRVPAEHWREDMSSDEQLSLLLFGIASIVVLVAILAAS
jgi:hypothetical protein